MASRLLAFLYSCILVLIFSSPVSAQTSADWPMPGYNVQRSSWGPTGPKGLLKGEWAKPIEPYISQKVQIVAADGKIFLSTAKGLYAFNATDGNQAWVYATSMPLGHSSTYVNGNLYVAGFDRKIHAINATNGSGLWTYTAGGGFAVNPLVVNGVIYAGSRDGNMYAVNTNGTLKWKFNAGAPIAQSAAYAADTNSIYFGADNMFAYALNATTGAQVWKSAKMPGLAMNSWWPVVNGTSVYFTVATNFSGKLMGVERDAMYAGASSPDGTPYGAVTSAGQPMTMNTTKMVNYLNSNPGRRTLVMLNRSNGSEKTPYAPALWGGMSGSLTRYPPIVNSAGTLFFRNHTFFDGAIPGGHVTGWNEGASVVQITGNREIGGNGDYPIDEPGAIAGGGSTILHTMCCDRFITSYDTSVANTLGLSSGLFPVVNPDASNNRQWRAVNWKPSGYEKEAVKYFMHAAQTVVNDDMYYAHSDNNPPVPYNGKVYLHRGNALIALSTTATGTQLKSTAAAPAQPAKTTRPVNELQGILAAEIQKMLSAGNLRPGMFTVGLHDNFMEEVEPEFLDTFHNPSETYIILLRALPHLSSTMQSQLRSYIQARWNENPATNVKHMGYAGGAARENHVNLENKNGYTNKQTGVSYINYYAAWKYAKEFGNASGILNAIPSIQSPGTISASYPQKLNEAIAGFWGYCELVKLTGQSSCSQQSTLNSLISQRANNFQAEPANPLGGVGIRYYYSMPIAANFMYIQPEFAQSLNSAGKVTTTVAAHELIFPYWFLAKGTEMQGEGTMQPPQYYHGLFQAKARILKQSYAQLEPYLDAPAFAVGDLYYIDNLVAAIESACTVNCPTPPPASTPTKTPTPATSKPGDANGDGQVNGADYLIWISHYGQSVTGPANGDFNNDSAVNGQDYIIWLANYGT